MYKIVALNHNNLNPALKYTMYNYRSLIMKYRAHANQWRMQSWSQGGCAYAVGASRVSPPDLKKNQLHV